ERHAEVTHQRQPLLVVRGSGHEGDVHALHLLDLVDVDLGEDDLLTQPEGVISAAVEGLGGHALEVADAGERHAAQAVDELVHAVATEGHRAADGLALAQLEVRDGLPGTGDDGTLAGDDRQLLHRRLEDLVVGERLTQTHVDDDLLEARRLHGVLEVQLLEQRGNALLAVAGLHPRRADLEALLDDRREADALGLFLPALALLRLLVFSHFYPLLRRPSDIESAADQSCVNFNSVRETPEGDPHTWQVPSSACTRNLSGSGTGALPCQKHHRQSIVASHCLQNRFFFSPSTRMPTRVGLSHLPQTTASDGTAMVSGFSISPPSGFCCVRLRLRLITRRPSTAARFFSR